MHIANPADARRSIPQEQNASSLFVELYSRKKRFAMHQFVKFHFRYHIRVISEELRESVLVFHTRGSLEDKEQNARAVRDMCLEEDMIGIGNVMMVTLTCMSHLLL